MKPLRVLLASAAYRPHTSGVAEHVWNLARQLRLRGHEPHVLTLAYDRATPAEPGVTRIARASVVPANRSRITLSFAPGLRARVRRFLRGREFDVIHCHGFFPPDPCYWILESAPAPAVITFHTFGVRVPAPARTCFRLLCGRGWRNARALVAVSRAGRRWAEALLGRECLVIPNGVDPRVYHPRAPVPGWFPRRGPVLLYVGRLDPRKGLPVLLRALPGVLKEFPGTRLVVAGAGPLERRCRRLAARLGTGTNVIFAGRVGSDDLPGCYAGSTAFVSPTLGGEAMGIVLIEALASGTPVIASDIPGYDEVIRHEQDGLLTPPGNPAALARAVIRLLGDRELSSRLRDRGRARAEDFAWDKVTDAILQVYEKLLT